MKDIIRKAVLLGLGGYHYAKDGINDFVKDLEKDGKITPEEGKKLVDEVFGKGREFADKQASELKEVVQKAISEMGIATKEDINKLVKTSTKKKE